ncbi:unnamed protein product, partial [Sphacelaria rigidula]
MKLRKSLSGLRHGPKKWFGTMGHYLAKIRFSSLKSNPCIDVFEGDTASSIQTLYVEDILLL